MFGPLRGKIEAAVAKVEGLLSVSFDFLFLFLFASFSLSSRLGKGLLEGLQKGGPQGVDEDANVRVSGF